MDYFLVCGLGYLGQHCVIALKKFGVKVIAIEKNPPSDWEVKNLRESLDELIIGDCSQQHLLLKTPISQIRAALIVTTVEKVNLETAIALRRLNSHTRLIVRGDRENLNYLLSNQLGNFVAYEPKHLPANAYGYGVIPVIYQSHATASPVTLPSDDIRLAVGDLLIVLATIEGLKAIELGKPHIRQWQLEILSAKSEIAIFDGITAISRISGCSLKTATETMNNLPSILPVKMYHHQAVRLKKVLQQNQIQSRLKQLTINN